MRLPWLPDVLQAAGLQVDTYPGWETRGSESWGPLRGLICHATASSQNSTDAGDMRVLWVTGSVTAPAPISQLFLSRSGTWTVGATGRCNHVLTGDKGPHRGYGNSYLIGVEAQNDNRGEPWSPHMLDSYIRGVAAICGHMGWPASVVAAHREHQTGKSDPYGVDMDAFRADVQAILSGEDDDMLCQKGQSGRKVQALQFLLVECGADLGPAGADGKYGQATADALAAITGDAGDDYGPWQWAKLFTKHAQVNGFPAPGPVPAHHHETGPAVID